MNARQWLSSFLFLAVTGCGVDARELDPDGQPGEANTATHSDAIEGSPDLSCLQDARLLSFTTTAGMVFTQDNTQLSWNVLLPCDGMALYLNSGLVQEFGSKTVSPDLTTSYTLKAYYAGQTRVLGTITIVAAVDYSYALVGGSYTTYAFSSSSVAQSVRSEARQILRSLPQSYRKRFEGKKLEIHIVPSGTPVTALPAFSHLEGEMTWDGRPWSETRGGGGQDYGNGRIVMFVGAETQGPNYTHAAGHVLAHELGHTVLDFFHPNEASTSPTSVQSRFAAHVAAGRTCLTLPSYNCANRDEWFAEGTAALFEYQITDAWADRYNPTWLGAHNPELFAAVNEAYSLR